MNEGERLRVIGNETKMMMMRLQEGLTRCERRGCDMRGLEAEATVESGSNHLRRRRRRR